MNGKQILGVALIAAGLVTLMVGMRRAPSAAAGADETVAPEGASAEGVEAAGDVVLSQPATARATAAVVTRPSPASRGVRM